MKKEDKIALFRYGIIAPVIHKEGIGQNKYFKEMEQQVFDVPVIGVKKFKKGTFKSWLSAYRKYGIDGLKLKERSDKGRFKRINENIEKNIASVITNYNIVSSSQLYRMLISGGDISGTEFSEQTLREYVKTKNLLLPNNEPVPRKRFEKEHVNELWISDFMHGPNIKKQKTFLCCIIDDHSRVITGYGWYYNENSSSLEHTLKAAILRFGVPKVLYCDNGSVYIASNLQFSCARCGIALVHTKPYDAAAKGKIERFFRTVRDMFMPLIDFKNIILEELNDRFSEWIENEYHKKLHSGINQPPINRYLDDIKYTQISRISEVELKLMFYVSIKRRVKNDSTVSVNAAIYESPTKYIGRYIEIRFATDTPEDLFIFENDKFVYKLKKINLVENADIFHTPVFTFLMKEE